MSAKLSTWARDLLARAESEGEPALRALKDKMVQQNIQIQSDLADDKRGMLAERADYLADGATGRDAQMKASATTDFEWRGRAAYASSVRQQMIAHINGRLRELQATRNVKSGQRPTGAIPPERTVAHIANDQTLEESRDFVQTWIDDGWSPVGVIPRHDGTLIVFRKDF